MSRLEIEKSPQNPSIFESGKLSDQGRELYNKLHRSLRRGLMLIICDGIKDKKLTAFEKRKIVSETIISLRRDLLLQYPENEKLLSRVYIEILELLQKWLDSNYAPGKARGGLIENDIHYLHNLINTIFVERFVRGKRLFSESMREAIEIQKEVFGDNKIIFFRCIDGRVWKTLICGITPNAGHAAIARAAGDAEEFVKTENGDLEILPNSDTARTLDLAISEGRPFTIYLDSHVGCAAGNIRQCNDLVNKCDSGLYHDIERKIKMASAIKRYVSSRAGKVTVIHGSFDPHKGDMFVGLDKPEVMNENKRYGFAPNIISNLCEQNKIASSKYFSDKLYYDFFNDIFRGYIEGENIYFDWSLNLSETASSFWKAFKSFYRELLPKVKEYLSSILFSENSNSQFGEEEVNQISLIFLLNSFNYFCQQNYKPGYSGYPHGSHTEHAVLVTEEEFGPYFTMTFSEWGGDSVDEHTLGPKIIFDSKIIRQNRGESRITSNSYDDKEDFTNSPVPVIFGEILKTGGIDINWDEMERINWNFLTENNGWFFIDNNGIYEELHKKQGVIDIRIIDLVKKLVTKMKAICKPGTESARQIANGRLALIPVIMDESRIIRKVIPMVYRGMPPTIK